MSQLKSIESFSTNILGKSDKKKINKTLKFYTLEIDAVYKISLFRNKITIISHDEIPILFKNNTDFFLPTLNLLETSLNLIKTCFLDKGALKPILNGSNVMAPGIYKYKNMIVDHFNENEIVSVGIIDDKLIGVGLSKVNSMDLSVISKGVAIEILHFFDDPIYKWRG